jgi:signal transduction histidine kinase
VSVRRGLSRSQSFDLALALAMLTLCEVQVATGTGQSQLGGPAWLGVLSGFALGIPLVWRRSHPGPVLLAGLTTVLTVALLGLKQPKQGYIGEIVAVIVMLYSLARYGQLRQALVGLALVSVPAVAVSANPGFFTALGSVLLLSAPVAIGHVLRARRLLIDQLRSTAHALALSQQENAHAAVAAERVRIARELHDLVAHAVSVMVVQAGAASQVLDTNTEKARQAMLAVQDSGREALAELHRLLGMLRPDRPAASSAGPQPGLAELERLTSNVQEAGVSIELRRDGVARELPRGLDLAAFRIIQEALTNVLKHADASQAQVTLAYRNDSLELSVLDNGRGGSENVNGSRHGLVGMQERATLYGGEFHAGPDRQGGYAVRARFPIAPGG